MEELVNTSLERYFNTLSKFGYKSYSDVDRLLMLIFIQELLDSDCRSFITEKEYMTIHKSLYCLYGYTCLIPYPEYISDASVTCSGKTV